MNSKKIAAKKPIRVRVVILLIKFFAIVYWGYLKYTKGNDYFENFLISQKIITSTITIIIMPTHTPALKVAPIASQLLSQKYNKQLIEVIRLSFDLCSYYFVFISSFVAFLVAPGFCFPFSYFIFVLFLFSFFFFHGMQFYFVSLLLISPERCS